MAPTAGMLVSNNVRLVSPLAEGGMGSVWIAEHLGLSTQVAVKFISEEILKHDISVERFKREATAAAQIRSQHVVQVFDHGLTEDGVPYIVMELMEGEDLGKRVERLGPLSVELTSTIVTQACRALSRAHALGIVHRDIKPDNLFICEADGELVIKVLDFGVAKKTTEFSSGVTTTGVVVGTPSYMSPEQVLSSKDVDGRSDLWSLGVVAYHCLTAKVPFEGETFGALAVAINAGTYPPLTEVRPELPPVLDQWMSTALAHDRDRRFSTAKGMAGALARAVNPHAPLDADSTGGIRAMMQSSGALIDGRGTAMPSTQPSPGPMTLGSADTYSAATSTPEPSGPGLMGGHQPTFDGASVEAVGGARRRRGLRAAAVVAVALVAGLGAAAVVFAPDVSKLGAETDPSTGQENAEQAVTAGDDGEEMATGSEADGTPTADPTPNGSDTPTVSAAGGPPVQDPKTGGATRDGSPSPNGTTPAATASAPVSPGPGQPTAKPAPTQATAPPKPPQPSGGAPTPAPFPQMDDRGF